MIKPPLRNFLALLIGVLGIAFPAFADDSRLGESYRLSARDLIAVYVYQQEDLTVEQRIDAVGKVQIPLAGALQVAGLTVREAEELIEVTYREKQLLSHPQVTVQVIEYSPKQVSVLGEVEAPGMVEFAIETYRMDLREVIARAGGFTPVARKGSIQVFRKQPDGSEESFRVDFDDLIEGGSDNESLYVYDKDVIFVPDRIF